MLQFLSKYKIGIVQLLYASSQSLVWKIYIASFKAYLVVGVIGLVNKIDWNTYTYLFHSFT